MKKLMSVIVALIFIMLVFVPAVDNHMTANANKSSNDKNNEVFPPIGSVNNQIPDNMSNVKNYVAHNNINSIVGNNNLHWIKINTNNNMNNTTASYAIYNNKEYIKTDIRSNIPEGYQNKVSVIMGKGFDTILRTGTKTITVFTMLSTHGNMNNNLNNGSTLIISNGKVFMEKINDPLAHKSFSWGQAWVSCASYTVYGSTGLAINLGIIGMAAGSLRAAVGALADATIAGVVGILSAVVVGSWSVWVIAHKTSNNEYIPYVEIAFSEGKWWDPWDTGAYGELGAYSNQAYDVNGKLSYTGPYLYFPLLNSEALNTGASAIASAPHGSIWPSLSPPW